MMRNRVTESDKIHTGRKIERGKAQRHRVGEQQTVEMPKTNQ